MKLHKTLSIDSQTYALIDSQIQLNLFTPGTATFTLESQDDINGLVIFKCGYDASNQKTWFIGYVENSHAVDKKQRRIFCRELTAVLSQNLFLSLRLVTLPDILNEVSERVGLNFVVPENAPGYTTTQAPAYYNLSSGYFAMDALARVFSIDKLIWQQSTDGDVFVGSWSDSDWSSKPVSVDTSWEYKVLHNGGASITAVPSLRPGVLYNDRVITSVLFSGLEMTLTWSKNPWNKNL